MEQRIFDEEQQHLQQTYEKLVDIHDKVAKRLAQRAQQARKDNADAREQLAIDLSGEVNVETYVEYEALNKIIDEYNLANTQDAETLRNVETLLVQPYFAKIDLQLLDSAKAQGGKAFSASEDAQDGTNWGQASKGLVRSIYIGTAGVVDDMRHHFIVDWRSPVAEVYYNQSNGKTSYTVDGRTINVLLKLRRQFDISGKKLNAYFDTTVAIQDPLLLNTLSHSKSNVLQDITATIQREQNTVIRHEDVPVLLVSGVAGSGKTSVMLQRIAYLFYTMRQTLKPKEVYLITPNAVFQKYINRVLPNMGEQNPHTVTWLGLMQILGLSNRGCGEAGGVENLNKIGKYLPNLELEQADFQDIRIQDERVLTANQAFSSYMKFKQFPAGIHRCLLTMEDMHSKIDARINRLASSDDIHDQICSLPEEEAVRLFGAPLDATNEDELRKHAKKYLRSRYRSVYDAIEDALWLRIDRIGMRMLEKKHLSSTEYLFLKLCLAGGACKEAKYVMIDEVQDYTQEQLMVLAKYFCNAHFLLLGDPNQAIKKNTASFEEIKNVFTTTHGRVQELFLNTSYRSTPEITELFTRFMENNERIQIKSVQRSGVGPCIIPSKDLKEFAANINKAIKEALRVQGLTALMVRSAAEIEYVRNLLDSEIAKHVQNLDYGTGLPESGVVLLDLSLAKGLEFDNVIIVGTGIGASAQRILCAEELADIPVKLERLERCSLYTAISRATHKVTVIYSVEK